MIKRKNILAENMLRFRSKNIAAEEAAAIRKLIEQVTVKYKNAADIKGFFDDTANPFTLVPKDAKTVIFSSTLPSGATVPGAVSGDTNAIKLPGTNFYLAVGQIGKVNNSVNPIVNNGKAGAILFTAAENPSGGVPIVNAGEPIPYTGNLAAFASDIVRATGVNAANKFGEFSRYEGKLASVLKASAELGITGADKLVPSSDPTSYYANWKLATKKLLSAA